MPPLESAPAVDSPEVKAPAAAVVPPPAPPPDQDFSERFAGLTKRERELRAQQRTFEQEREKAKRQDDEYNAYQQTKESAKKNPIAFLKSLGLTYEDLTDSFINDDKPTTEQELKQLREDLDNDRKARLETQTAAEKREQEAEIAAFMESISSHTKTNSDKYELIEAQGAQQLVFNVMEQYYHEQGSVPDLDVACQHVEEYLEGEARRLMSLKKFSAAPKEDSADKGQGQKNSPTNLTITNDGTAAPAGTPPTGKMSREQSIAHAASMLRFN